MMEEGQIILEHGERRENEEYFNVGKEANHRRKEELIATIIEVN
jgi:hypothetical protein